MKTSLTTLALLVAVGTAQAQQTAAPTAVVTTDTALKVERYVLYREPNPMKTAADSARERARLANAAALRKQAMTPPRPVPTTPATYTAQAEANDPAVKIAGQALSPEELTERERIRRAQEQEMINRAFRKKDKDKVPQVATGTTEPTNSTGRADKSHKSRRHR